MNPAMAKGRKLLGREERDVPSEEHAVVIRFTYGEADLAPLHALKHALKDHLEGFGVGVYDGHEIAVDMSDGYVYLYGPNAERLFAHIEPTLRACAFMKGASVTLRFGPPEEATESRSFTL